MPTTVAKAKRMQSALAAARSAGVSSESIAKGEKILQGLRAQLQQKRSSANMVSSEPPRPLLSPGAAPASKGQVITRPASAGSLSIRQKPGDRGRSPMRPLSATNSRPPQETPCEGQERKSYRVGITERNCTFGDLLAQMRNRKLSEDPVGHLKQSCLQMGVRTEYMTTSKHQQLGPIAKAQDPKWSTDLKRIDAVIGLKIQYENRLSASLTGSISPELQYLPKTY
eukprot:TRINITY_DN46374_c0_g1_i1.p1 TRINITY_DN46374_c0_g1~~TRINITY_DN46374_c0_g1_i1.p1  ORF type:complete len:226 (+),score=33.24 TRINITY_DN46374_c0_g1_i1:200-877(+)